ncbi:MAG TPA: single-stranded-DNA-specific exonuclease RecJ [Gaiellaceae bacterium]|nr:single-stranded-DNA-specific exonuclease RecJ [Gaiellaceae bacterium]
MQWTVARGSIDEARNLADAVGVSETTARVLVRRGYADVEIARRFLDGQLPEHDVRLLGDVDAACAAIHAAIANGTRICVHGDYDVDGICATALAVSALRALGADVGWHLPSRFEEGYGLSGQTMSRLAEEGYGLILTVDCGITAVEEVAEAKRLGLDVIVTDHHRPGDELPDCPIVATRPSEYPFPELCGTGVAFKLAEALEAPGLDDQLDLVALATIADVVPLVDENRGLAIAGLAQLRLARRPGIAALMRTARVDPATVDEGQVAFRLAPRINAAGRLCRPEAALELLLTDDPDEAARLAQRLEELNRDRQAVEDRILRAAVDEVESWPAARQAQRGFVIAGEDWHEGVIGIVASRLVERYRRPVVLIAGTDGDWKGSGRSISAFDLHGALGACAEHLQRFGGHRAAAGLSIRPDDVDAFARAFAAHADGVLTDADLAPPLVVDAVVPARACTLALADELRRLAPFGLGNPGVTLLVAGCEITDLQTVGEGKHLRFRAADENGPAGGAIAFGMGTQLDRWRRPGSYDVAFRLEPNTWNGTTVPQLVVRRIFECPDRYRELRTRLAAEWKAGPDAWSPDARAVFEELGLDDAGSWRSLLESEAFRALIEPEPVLAEAA